MFEHFSKPVVVFRKFSKAHEEG